MKIQAEILGIRTHGEKLQIELQGQHLKFNDSGPWLTLTIQVPTTKTTSKTFYIGRTVNIFLEAKP